MSQQWKQIWQHLLGWPIQFWKCYWSTGDPASHAFSLHVFQFECCGVSHENDTVARSSHLTTCKTVNQNTVSLKITKRAVQKGTKLHDPSISSRRVQWCGRRSVLGTCIPQITQRLLPCFYAEMYLFPSFSLAPNFFRPIVLDLRS